MFPNNGPMAAHNAVKSYIARVGLSGFAEDHQTIFEGLLALPLFETLTDGVERLYAAVRELEDLPERALALQALGEAAQASAVAGLSGKAGRRWAIQAWVVAEINEPGGEHPLAPAPEVDEAFSFIPPEAAQPSAPADT